MKFPSLYAACLLLATAAVLAGCNGTPASPATVTPVFYTELPELALTPGELPFAPQGQKEQVLEMKDPTFIRFAATRAFSKFYINEKQESPTSTQLGQMIVEFPRGNTPGAFADFKNQTKAADQTVYKITWLPDPGIGDESYALTITDTSGTLKPQAMVIFRKSRIMESVVMIGPSPDIDALTRTAGIAAAKIPL